jgi:phosphoglycerate kinase
VAKYLPSYAGLLLEKEIVGLSKAIVKPKKPFMLVLGGAKMETKIPVLKNLLPKVDHVLIGGGLFNTYLWAKGYKVGASLIDKEYKKEALKLLGNKKVVLPVDVVTGREDGSGEKVMQIANCKLQNNNSEICNLKSAIFDIGPRTIGLYAQYIKKAQTLVWNGAMGYFEQKPYDVGTMSIARLVASRAKGKAFGIIGGGETLQAMEMVKMTEFVDLVSTGGGAMLEFLGGKKLPGVKAVSKK